ncbi:MAG: SPOR domain-containing protein [Candidatus Omnitrophica bacterium]|nr:SPOR domain-containing protein [Candidatus Omnitrophota bacterium]
MFNPNPEQQAELFQELSDQPQKSKRAKFNLTKIALILSYENIIILSIGLVMVLIVCYSLGVERGKYLVQAKSEDLELRPTEQTEQVQETQSAPTVKPDLPKQGKKIKIQVATFRSDKYAEIAKKRLEHSGFQPFVVTRGTFREVCVGGYSDKQEAKQALKELRKMYADCFIRN